MKRVIVVGVGNRLMKDDGIGVLVAEKLMQSLKDDSIEVITGETDVQFCLRNIEEKGVLIILDGIYTNSEPGTIVVIALEEILENSEQSRTQHELSLVDALRLHQKKPQGVLIGIEIAEVDYGLELSEIVSLKFEDICNEIGEIIKLIAKDKITSFP